MNQKPQHETQPQHEPFRFNPIHTFWVGATLFLLGCIAMMVATVWAKAIPGVEHHVFIFTKVPYNLHAVSWCGLAFAVIGLALMGWTFVVDVLLPMRRADRASRSFRGSRREP